MTTHTPTPWKMTATESTYDVKSEDGIGIVSTSWHDTIRHPWPLRLEAQANAAFIVKAVNCHDELVDALKACAAILPRYHLMGKTLGDDEEHSVVMETVADALAQAAQ